MTEGLFDDADIIHVYLRSEAIDDGSLVDVTAVAREAGITFPVAITAAAWVECVALPPGYIGTQDENGRLWDVVWMTRHAIRTGPGGRDRVPVEMLVVDIEHGIERRRPRLHHLVAQCGPGDDGEPVITIMQPGED